MLFLRFLGLLLVLALACSADAVLSVEPPASTVVVGDNFSLSISIANVADLYAFQFDLGFSPSILQAVSVTEGGFLSAGGSTFFFPGFIDNTAGIVSFVANTLSGPVPGVTGGGLLATVNFNAIGAGPSSLSLAGVVLLDSQDPQRDIAFQSLDGLVQVNPAVAPVPEPSTGVVVAMVGGLLALRHLRRRPARLARERATAGHRYSKFRIT